MLRKRRALLVTLLFAGFCALLLQARVYTDFERLRFGVVRKAQPVSGRALTIPLPDLSRLAGQPIAVVLRLALNGSTSRAVRIAIDGGTTATARLSPGRETRVDFSLPDGAVLAAGDLVEITSDGDGWSLNYLEVANVHGFSRGLFEFMIVPAAATSASPVGGPLSVALFVLMLRFRRHPAGALRRRTVRVSYVVAAALVHLFLAAILVAPLVSDYGVLLAWHTFVVLLAVLYYPTLDAGFRRAQPALRAAASHLFQALLRAWAATWRRRVPLLYMASFVLFVIGTARFHDPETGFTSFIHFGAPAADEMVPGLRDVPLRVVPNSPGYDGQFYAQLAVDPLLLDAATGEALDNPSYRARRILFSWTAFLLGLGQPRLVVHAYAIQNALFWVVLALLLMRWFPAQDFRSFCLWFGCMFSHGAVVSVVWALPDGPSLLFLGLAVLAMERGRTRLAAALVGLGGLAKDINLLWSAVPFNPADVRRRDWRAFCVRGLLIVGRWRCGWSISGSRASRSGTSMDPATSPRHSPATSWRGA